MGGAFTQTGLFLVTIIFTFYITLILLRFLLQIVKADFYNPICQFIVKLTSPVLVPIRRVIPGFFGLDLAAIILAIILQAIELVLISLMVGYPISWWFAIPVVLRLLSLTLNIYFFAILIQALMSWLNPNPNHPMTRILGQLTDPILRPFRRFIPPIAGMDLSPLAALIVIQVINIFLKNLM